MNLTSELLRRTAFVDIEIAEDLKRRMPSCPTIKDLSNFFRMLLSQYQIDTLLYRATIKDVNDIEVWFADFFRFVLPFIKQHGMPEYTDTKSLAMYQTS